MKAENEKRKAKNYNDGKGFTIIELLVAVAIIAVVSSFVFASVGKKQQDAIRAAQKLALDIRAAQNKALAPTDNPACIYGIKIASATSYFLYYDPLCTSGHQYNAGTSVMLSPSALDGGVAIANFSGQDFAFEAPEPITYLDGATGAAPLAVTFQGQGGQRSVIINRFGRAEIQ